MGRILDVFAPTSVLFDWPSNQSFLCHQFYISTWNFSYQRPNPTHDHICSTFIISLYSLLIVLQVHRFSTIFSQHMYIIRLTFPLPLLIAPSPSPTTSLNIAVQYSAPSLTSFHACAIFCPPYIHPLSTGSFWVSRFPRDLHLNIQKIWS